MQGFKDYATHPFEVAQNHKVYSPEYLERAEGGYSRDVADIFKSGAEKRIYKGRTSIPEKMMGGVKLLDKGAVIPGMQGAVLQVLDEFKIGKLSSEVKKALDISEENIPVNAEDRMKLAYKFADWVTERTQPMFSLEHRSSLSRGNALEKLFTQFSAFTNQALNGTRRLTREAIRTGSQKDWAKLAKWLILLFVVNTGGVMAIDEIRTRLYRRKTKPLGRKVGGAILDSAFSLFYFVRDIESSLKSKVEKGTFLGYDISIPIWSAGNLFVDTLANGIRAIQLKGEKGKKAAMKFVDEAIELILMSQGIPYNTPKKIIKGVIGEEKKKGRMIPRVREQRKRISRVRETY